MQSSRRTLPRFALLGAVSFSLLLGGCGAGAKKVTPPGDTVGSDGGGGGGNIDPDGNSTSYSSHLQGKVVAPEGTIPIGGALVYLTTSPPDEIPDHVYCDKCVHLPDGTPFTKSNPDGTFDLGVNATPGTKYLLVVQKGAFRRVRPILVSEGVQSVPLALTKMPSITDKPNGDDVPKIAIMLGAWDPIELVLARMGLKATITKGGFLGTTTRVLAKDAPSFAIYGIHDLGETPVYGDGVKLITDPAEISKYHIVFIPCSGSSGGGTDPNGPRCSGVYDYDAKVKTTLDGFVKQGGRLYVSDWSYEYVRQVFPGYVSWRGQDQNIGSACMDGGGDQSVSKAEPGLLTWLKAQNKTLDTVKDAWTYLSGLTPQMDVNADGQTVSITPKVWVEAAGAAATTSFQHGCGRVLYTTYHTQPTSETSAPLEPQALTLLYLILEIDVCIDENIPG